MTVPEDLLKKIYFKTDLKSILRGLNSLLGLNMSRSRLKSIRLYKNNVMNLIVSQIDLIKFIIETDSISISDSNKGIMYNELTEEYSFIDKLSGDPKEALFIFEDIDSGDYTRELIVKSTSFIRPEKYHLYKDLLSAVLDAHQLNNSLLFVYHDKTGSYIVNRALFPDPGNDPSFYYYSKLFKIQDSTINEKTNFVIVNRFELTITSKEMLSDADLSQMTLPVVHLRSK